MHFILTYVLKNEGPRTMLATPFTKDELAGNKSIKLNRQNQFSRLQVYSISR
jgi:hypothetical protein